MNKIASVEKIKDVIPHPNGDRLDIVTVLGYQCITQRGLYNPGDIVIYIQPDSILPELEWAEDYRKYSPKRIKAVKLRGEWSEGCLVSKDLLEGVIDTSIFNSTQIGNDVSHLLGITHYEPPAPQELNAKGFLPHGIGKTDEERWENMVERLPINEPVDITLKIDGCLKGDTIVLTEIGELSIQDIVDQNRIGLNVATVNVDNGCTEYQPILSTSVSPNTGKQWYEIELETGEILTLTENHKVWLSELNCYRRADELEEGLEVCLYNK
jgi:tRNA-binding EMAP/Myf-like protein